MRSATVSLVGLAVLSLTACNALFGISDAEVDPTFTVDGGGGGGTGGAPPQGCNLYCGAMMKNCTGAQKEYIDFDTCMAMCKFDPGVESVDDDSLACRVRHALLARDAPKDHCRSAGPLGYQGCAKDPCKPFCFLAATLCKSKTGTAYPDELTCYKECKKFSYDLSKGDVTVIGDSDTLNCRIYHLESAYSPASPSASDDHCPHTYPKSGPCSDPGASGAGGMGMGGAH